MTTYESDGHTRVPVPDEVMVGTVLRMVNQDGGVSPFSDMVVIGIHYKGERHEEWDHLTLDHAVTECMKEYSVGLDTARSKVQVILARPYLYADSIGCCPNWLQGVEKFDTSARQLLEHYKVVVSSNDIASRYCK